MTDEPPQPAKEYAAGWYPDRNMVNTRRYWDGKEWTEHTAPMDPDEWAGRPPRNSTSGVETIGYLTAIFVPIVGFVIGLFLIGKSDHAGKIIGLSMIVFLVLLAVLSSQQ